MSPLLRFDTLQPFQAVNVNLDPGHIPGPVIVPQCIQVIIRWTLNSGRTGHNVLYGRYAGAVTPTVAMADAIKIALSTGAQYGTMASFIAPGNGISGVDLRDVNVKEQPLVSGTTGTAQGTSTGTDMPNEVAIAITLRTDKTGPGNRGRLYIPGWASNAVAPGNVVAGACVTALQAWANTIPGALTGQALTFVLGQPARAAYTGSTGKLHEARAATSRQILSQTVRDNHFDTIRRRGLK